MEKGPRPVVEEMTVCIDTYIMNLKVIRKTSQQYQLEQQPHKHLRLRNRNKVQSPSDVAEVAGATGFLVLRDPGTLEIVPKASKQPPLLLELGKKELCFSHDIGASAYTNVAVLTDNDKDPVNLYVWAK